MTACVRPAGRWRSYSTASLHGPKYEPARCSETGALRDEQVGHNQRRMDIRLEHPPIPVLGRLQVRSQGTAAQHALRRSERRSHGHGHDQTRNRPCPCGSGNGTRSRMEEGRSHGRRRPPCLQEGGRSGTASQSTQMASAMPGLWQDDLSQPATSSEQIPYDP